MDVFPIFSRKTLGIDGAATRIFRAAAPNVMDCSAAVGRRRRKFFQAGKKDLQSDVSPFILSQSSPSTTSHHPLDWDFFPEEMQKICCQQKELKFLQLDEFSIGSPGPSHHNKGCFSCFNIKVLNKARISREPAGFCRLWPDLNYHKDVILAVQNSSIGDLVTH